MNAFIRFLLVGATLVIVNACATTPPPVPTGNPEELVSRLESDLAAARAEKVDVLAPGLFKEAQSAYTQAKQALDKGAKLTSIGTYVAEGNASLIQAREIAQVSRTILGETSQAREKALAVGADKLGKPYMDVEQQYLSLTKAIENDNLSYAQKNAAKVQADFRALEIMAIKNNALGDARRLMAEAEDAKIQKRVPKAYNDARLALKEADAYIEMNPYATEMIGQMAARAQYMAQRMMMIDESSRQFDAMTPEASALYVERLMAQLGDVLEVKPMKDQPVDDQLELLAGAAGSLRGKNQALESEISTYQLRVVDLERRLSGLQGYAQKQETTTQKLAEEREFNERFNQVQRNFRPDEAEVYKQGNQLVIRLRGIKFPVGQATLNPANYTLLSKVQQAIQTFDGPVVTIEGHTDSTGSAQTNQELSQKRAEAVKTYLVANKTLPAYRIRATGYGPDRPLAPNTTAEGRAVNRRIDVLITPSQAP